MSRRKGSLHELEGKKELETDEWKVFKPQKTSMFGTQDIFNMFDIVAVKGARLRFVQVKTNSTAGFLKRLTKWRSEHEMYGVSWELWVRYDARIKDYKWKKYFEMDY